MIPVGHVNIRLVVYIAPMRCTENACGNIVGTELVIRPLALLRVVADKRDRRTALVDDRNPTLQLRDDGVVPMKTNLAQTPQMLRDVASELAVKSKWLRRKFPDRRQAAAADRSAHPRLIGDCNRTSRPRCALP